MTSIESLVKLEDQQFEHQDQQFSAYFVEEVVDEGFFVTAVLLPKSFFGMEKNLVRPRRDVI